MKHFAILFAVAALSTAAFAADKKHEQKKDAHATATTATTANTEKCAEGDKACMEKMAKKATGHDTHSK